MPENLRQAYEISGSAFDQKLAAVAGVFQNIKASAMHKQQLAERLSQQKELMDYEYGLRTGVEQVKGTQKAQADLIDNFNKSLKDATTEVTKLQNEINKGEFSSLGAYNINEEYDFSVGVDQENLRAQVTVSRNAEPISYADFRNELSQYNNFVRDVLKPVQDGDITIDGVDSAEYISRIKSDVDYRRGQLEMYKTGDIFNSLVSEEGTTSSGGKQSVTKNVVPTIAQLKQKFKDSGPVKQYTWYENTLKPFDESKGAFQINYDASTASVLRQIENAITGGILPKSSQLKIGSLSKDVRTKIANGMLTGDEIKALPASIRDDVEALNNVANETTRDTLKELITNYNTWQDLTVAYGNDTGNTLRPDQVRIDLWGDPVDMNASQFEYEQVFKPLTEDLSETSVQEKNTKDFSDFLDSIERDTGRWSPFN